MEPVILGIDIAKEKFDVALLSGEKVITDTFSNTTAGFGMLKRWLAKNRVERIHACLEATGTYGEALSEYLHRAGHTVSVVNPARIKGFGQGELSRTKTDKADAQLIARFCRAMRPEPWQPPAPEVKELQSLIRRLEALNSMLEQEKNRLGTADDVIKESIKRVITCLQQERKATRKLIRNHVDRYPDMRGKRDLLESIPGIGPGTSAMILAEFGDVTRFPDAGSMASFCGLTPRHRQSGSSVRGRSMISKTGSSRIRKALFMPALASVRCNPVIAALRARLRASGKHPMAIVCAIMRKLIHIAFGVLKSGRLFEASIAAAA